jgi:TPR repeat protein
VKQHASIPGETDGYQVSDILVQYADLDPQAPCHIVPEDVWMTLIEHASPEACDQIGDAADRDRHARQFPIAERAFRKAADHGIARAMYGLGFLRDKQEKKDEAEQWYRKAAENGHALAGFALAISLAERGEAAKAVQWLRRAADAGVGRVAEFFLGTMLGELGENAEAVKWLSKAANAGDAAAIFNLGVVLSEQGEDAKAEEWYRKASGSTEPYDEEADAAWHWAAKFEERGEEAKAEKLYRYAAARGHVMAIKGIHTRWLCWEK